MRARQRLSKLLLRHDVRYEDTTSALGRSPPRWLAQIDLGQPGAQATLTDYLGAIEALELRRDTLETTIAQLVPGTPCAQTVARLRCLRGIDTLSAVGLCAEIGDFDALPTARAADGLCRARPRPSTAAARPAARDTSPSPAHSTPAGCWSRRHGITAARHARNRRSSAASKTRARPWSRSPGKPSSGCTTSGAGLTASATCAARSSRSQSRATSPGSAGRSSTTTTTTRSSQTNRRDSQNPRSVHTDDRG